MKVAVRGVWGVGLSCLFLLIYTRTRICCLLGGGRNQKQREKDKT